MEPTLINVFKNLGLTEKEAKVYLSCIEKGSAPVSHIAEGAGINRVTTYTILEKLIQKGLVSHFTKNKVKYFASTDPEIVVEEYEKRAVDLKKALPNLKRLTGQTSHPKIRYFEGLDGIKTIYADTLTSKTEILNYSNSEEIRNNWPEYDKEYVEKRARKKIFLKGISPEDSAGIRVHAEDQKYNREIRLVPKEEFDFTNEINIYDDKVAIISFKDELIGMIIESPEIANSQRAIFHMCWQFSDLMNNKTKLLKPLSENELTQIIEKEQPKAEKKPAKAANQTLEENLSLF